MKANLSALAIGLSLATAVSLQSISASAQDIVAPDAAEGTSVSNRTTSLESQISTLDDEKLSRLVQLNPTTNKQEMLSQVTEYAKANGLTVSETIDLSLNASNASTQTPPEFAHSGPGKGGAVGKRKLEKAKTGHIFVTSSWLGPINHGHVGLYDTATTVIEATGIDPQFKFHNSRRVSYKNVEVYKGAVIQDVQTSTKNKSKAAQKARKHYVNKPYNAAGFAFNKAESEKLNCSQLVWLAYNTTSKIDLDANGGPGVYPWDIYNSKSTRTYKTLN